VKNLRKTTVVGISFPTELLEWIDETRGPIPRSRYIADILLKAKRAYDETEDQAFK